MRTLVVQLERVTFPPELADAGMTAAKHWEGDSSDEKELLRAKTAVWGYLEKHKGDDLRAKPIRSARALLCVLDPDGDEETAGATAEWFCEMLEE